MTQTNEKLKRDTSENVVKSIAQANEKLKRDTSENVVKAIAQANEKLKRDTSENIVKAIAQSNEKLKRNTSEYKDISVSCGDCHRKIFDGKVIRARAVNVAEGTALCRCKKWVKVPISLTV